MRLFSPLFALLTLSFLVTEPAFAAIKFKRFPHCPEGAVTVKTCECHAGTSGRYHFLSRRKVVRHPYRQVSQVVPPSATADFISSAIWRIRPRRQKSRPKLDAARRCGRGWHEV